MRVPSLVLAGSVAVHEAVHDLASRRTLCIDSTALGADVVNDGAVDHTGRRAGDVYASVGSRVVGNNAVLQYAARDTDTSARHTPLVTLSRRALYDSATHNATACHADIATAGVPGAVCRPVGDDAVGDRPCNEIDIAAISRERGSGRVTAADRNTRNHRVGMVDIEHPVIDGGVALDNNAFRRGGIADNRDAVRDDNDGIDRS